MEGDSARGDYKYLRALSPLLTHLRMDYGISQAHAQAADGCSSSLWPSLLHLFIHPSFLPSFLSPLSPLLLCFCIQLVLWQVALPVTLCYHGAVSKAAPLAS